MKKILSFAILLTVLFAGCKKDVVTTGNNTHKIAVSSFGFGDDIRYTITSSYIAKGSTTPMVLEKKDIVGSIINYSYSANLNTGDTFILEIKSTSDVSVNYTVYNDSKQITDARADHIAATGPVNFKYVVND